MLLFSPEHREKEIFKIKFRNPRRDHGPLLHPLNSSHMWIRFWLRQYCLHLSRKFNFHRYLTALSFSLIFPESFGTLGFYLATVGYHSKKEERRKQFLSVFFSLFRQLFFRLSSFLQAMSPKISAVLCSSLWI